ncbi:hypothetical protein GGQ71_002929 [Rhizobium taibaishanense]|uniref:Uncharacterized protein n=1 Tax=Allorhizobium taibaishanense TaxID=887144 RepID=A0A7W6HNU0_9HYPH|nr:hypothetical protein [Allorhizobium taibaishanense]MBB4008649.1 hypothetical protein [Allorhizobium taibaishanense]
MTGHAFQVTDLLKVGGIGNPLQGGIIDLNQREIEGATEFGTVVVGETAQIDGVCTEVEGLGRIFRKNPPAMTVRTGKTEEKSAIGGWRSDRLGWRYGAQLAVKGHVRADDRFVAQQLAPRAAKRIHRD